MAFNTLTDALKSILKDRAKDLKFFGKKAIYTIDAMNVAEISIGTCGTSGHYPQLVVKIQHKENGEIARNGFIFEEYLERKDGNKNTTDVQNMYLWGYNPKEGFDWYIVYPKTTKPICNAIFEYISCYS